MKTRPVLAAAAALLLTGPAFATSLSQPDFDAEHGGVSQLSYTGFQNFTVSSGTVDLIGRGNWDFGSDSSNLYVDMSGSSRGALTTKLVFDPGLYNITLDIGGPIYDSSVYGKDGVSVSWTGCGASCFSTGAIDGLDEEILHFSADLTAASSFTIADLGLSDNPNVGATLFGIDIAPDPVPEPMSLALLGGGLLALGFFARRRAARA